VDLTTIAHELRSPLAAILGNLSLLEHPRYADRHPELIRSLRRNAELMALSLANVALSESLPEVRFEPVSLGELFAEVDQLIRPGAEGKGLTFTVAEDAPAVHGELGLLRQVLLNLLTNAVRNTEAGEVSLTWVRLEGEAVRIDVADTGRGLSQAERLECCRRHARLEGHRAGLGLGLFVSAGILERHCSELVLASQPGVGTTASFTLEVA